MSLCVCDSASWPQISGWPWMDVCNATHPLTHETLIGVNGYLEKMSGKKERRVWLTCVFTSSFLNMRDRTSSGSTLKMALNRDGYGDNRDARYYILLYGHKVIIFYADNSVVRLTGGTKGSLTNWHFNHELGESATGQKLVYITSLFVTVGATLYHTVHKKQPQEFWAVLSCHVV